jgi:hypothetical protein
LGAGALAWGLLTVQLVRSSLIHGVLAAVLALTACVGTPQPNPPALDGDRLAAGNQRGSAIDIVGAPGAVQPPEATVWVTPLDTTADPVEVAPQSDGSFLVGVERGTHRLAPRLGDARGEGVDVEADVGLSIVRPAATCLIVPREVEATSTSLGGASELAVTIANDCAVDVDVVSATMRRASDFEIVEAPTRILAGTSGLVRVRFAPSAEGLREEIALVQVSGPADERRAVTLYGVATR